MENSNIFDNNSAHCAHEKTLIKALISLTILMVAGVVTYNTFFEPKFSEVNFVSENKSANTQKEKKLKKSKLININTASKKNNAKHKRHRRKNSS